MLRKFRFNYIVISAFLLLLEPNNALCQNELTIAKNFRNAYLKHTRSITGKPGKSYWQNRANYNIKVSFDPKTNLLSGNVEIDYSNKSPDTLTYILLKLYPNLYQKQAMRNVQVSAEDLTNGINIRETQVNGRPVDAKKQVIRGTNMYLKGLKITPNETTHVNISYAYTVNKTSFVRTGQVDSGAYVLAYFYPRIAVYDDLDGWNDYPYIGKEEFYNDYCNFNVAISIPGNYQAWATGNLQNPNQVYTAKVSKRIEAAERVDEVTDVITNDDLKAGSVTLNNLVNTWNFTAENVTDFAFAISNHYVWKASSLIVDSSSNRRTRVDAVYNPEHKTYEPVVNYARKTVSLISYKVPGIAFPYPHQTIFDGLDAMEYPMMVNDRPFDSTEVVQFTAHEINHALFPFFVGTNETKYSFMDEGWATFTEFTLQKLIDPKIEDTYDLSPINNSAGTDQDAPIMTLTPQLYGKARFSNKDLKPALGLRYIKEMLGDKLFYKAIKYYIGEWQGKHPTPYDFFNCLNQGSGTNLNWFWQNWFFEKNAPDLAIVNVKHSGNKYYIAVSRVGNGYVPVHLVVSYKDSSKQMVNRNISCWKTGAKLVKLSFISRKIIKDIKLGTVYDADADMSNNTWLNSKK